MAERTDMKERIKTLHEAILDLDNAATDCVRWDENPDGIPDEVLSPVLEEVTEALQKLCGCVSHWWELDQCGRLDHAYCLACSKSSTKEDYTSLKRLFPGAKVGNSGRFYDGWKGYEGPK